MDAGARALSANADFPFAARLMDVRVDYGRPVLGPLSLQLASSEILAIVGPSGCGKSTLLRVLAGLQTPSAGILERSRTASRASMVFQSATLAPWLSAAANVALPLRLAGVGRKEARAEARAALCKVGLERAADIRPARLSGGMAMRVALARAQLGDPGMLLMDEPFASVDDPTRQRLTEDVHRLWSASGSAMVLVTHNVEEAVFLGSRVIVLSRAPGRICGEFQIGETVPRPVDFRSTVFFRDTVAEVMSRLMNVAGIDE